MSFIRVRGRLISDKEGGKRVCACTLVCKLRFTQTNTGTRGIDIRLQLAIKRFLSHCSVIGLSSEQS